MKPFVVKKSAPVQKIQSERVKGELKPLDKYEEDIRNGENTRFVVNFFRTGGSVRSDIEFTSPTDAQTFAKESLGEGVFRAALIYAIDEYDHAVLHSTLRKGDTQFVYPAVQRW
jgi:hypothetical protein